MAKCVICSGRVTSGYVLCKDCADKLKPYTLSPELAYFIDQLAEELVLDAELPSCRICAIGDCASQVSGLTCRNAVKAWLLSRAKHYLCGDSDRCAAREGTLHGTHDPGHELAMSRAL